MMIPAAILHALKACQHALIAEDPYQWEHLTIEQLVSVYWINKNQSPPFKSQALINEMKWRICQAETTGSEREILRKTLANESGGSVEYPK